MTAARLSWAVVLAFACGYAFGPFGPVVAMLIALMWIAGHEDRPEAPDDGHRPSDDECFCECVESEPSYLDGRTCLHCGEYRRP